MTVPALWPALRALLLRVGRPLIRWLARGSVALALRITRATERRLKRRQRRVRVRLARATSSKAQGRLERRVAWLDIRRANWRAARLWLEQRREQLTRTVARELERLVDDAVPERAICEDFARWRAAGSPA